MFFSIVMPVYNAEKTLEKAARSILGQTYTNFELILVNDASVDGSLGICQKLHTADERCVVVDLKENSGLSNARNRGMLSARGEYILFVDSDDYVDYKMLYDLHNEIERHESDIVIFGMKEIFVDASNHLVSTNVLRGERFFSDDRIELQKKILEIQGGFLFRNSCNKAYKRELIIEIDVWFQNLPCVEDITFNLDVFGHIKSLSIVEQTPYCYVRRTEGTLTGRFFPDFWEVHYRMLLKKTRLFEKWGMLDEAQENILSDYVKFVFLSIMNDVQGGMKSDKDQRAFIAHVLETPLYQELDSTTRLKNIKLRALKFIFQQNWSFVLLWVAKLCLFVKVKIYFLWVKVIR